MPRGTGKQTDGERKPQKQVVQVEEVHTGMVLHHCPSEKKRHEMNTTGVIVGVSAHTSTF
jgi:hypothetical protein